MFYVQVRSLIEFCLRCLQPQMIHMVERTALECGEYAHCRAFNPSVFTKPEHVFGGEVSLPDCVIILHTKEGTAYSDHEVVSCASKAAIPTVGIVDTDCNPNIITYPVPGNDDTIEATQLYLHLFKQAILMGKKKRAEHGQKDRLSLA